MTLLQSSIVPGGATGGYQISRSLRFNIPDSTYLNRTLSTPTSRRIYTNSYWIKRSGLGVTAFLYAVGPNPGTWDAIRFDTNDTLSIRFSNDTYVLSTTQVFRDVSSWYHIVVAVDTTQATAANRVKLYVNGTQVTAFSGSYPTQNLDTAQLNANIARIGSATWNTTEIFPGYMTQINFIDGQQLDPTSFGETSTTTGVWNPKAYTGTYGTNGFYLNFSDNSNTTAATLGKDYSGNGNNWTPNNFSVTAGAGNDSLVDTPTNYGTDTGAGGEVRGNYCTLNSTATQGTVTASNGNLDVINAANSLINATTILNSGKWYWEVKLISGSDYFVGAQRVNIQNIPTNKFQVAGSMFYYSGNGGKYMNGDGGSAYGSSYTANDVIGVALNLDANTITFYKNNVSQGAITIVAADWVPCSVTGGTQCIYEYNFGQRAFVYSAPSGFKAICTQNLPTPTVGASSTTLANKYFDVLLWTGAGQTGTASITGLAFQPDFVWSKSRSSAVSHLLYDVLRGPSTSGASKSLSSNATATEGSGNDNSTYGYLSAFNSDGFSYYGGSSPTYFSTNGGTYVGWQWKGGGTGVTNTAGSITSTVSANTTSGFSVVTYTGTGASATIGHSLGVAPKMIIAKSRNGGYNWGVYHASLGNAGGVYLNTTDAYSATSTLWNSTTPTSSVFSVGNNGNTGLSGNNYVAYCFAEVAGYSKFGSYVGNGSADGPFVYCGFRPRFIIVKNTSAAASWLLYDTARSTYNVDAITLVPDLALAELNSSDWYMDILSNGFKFRTAYGQVNNSGNTFIFMAFAESPFNYSRAR